MLAIKGFPLKNATVVAHIIVVLMEHVARSNTVYTLLALLNGQGLMQIFTENEYLVVLRHLLQTISVELCRLCKVPRLDRFVLQTIEHQELKKLFVATILEHSVLYIS